MNYRLYKMYTSCIVLTIFFPLSFSFILNERFSDSSSFVPILINGEFNKIYNYHINSSQVYLMQFRDNQTEFPARITTESDDASNLFPILIVVQQPKSVVSWQIPYIVGSTESPIRQYPRRSRTLCPELHENNTDNAEQVVIMMVSTSSPKNLTFSVSVNRTDFNLQLNEERQMTISPSQSEFFSFTFPGDVSSALLEITSPNYTCMSLSIQNFSCPVYDQEDDLKYRGYWETITTKGGMMLTRDAFPQRLFVVFVAHADDEDCTGHEGAIQDRNKLVTFSIRRSITYREYLVAMISVIAVFAFIYIFTLILAVYWFRKNVNLLVSYEEDNSCIYTADEVEASNKIDYTAAGSSIDDSYFYNSLPSTSRSSVQRQRIVKHNVICVHDLSKLDHSVLRAKSNLYLWNLLTISVFYSLPVIQLVFTYQKVLNQSGNQDLCYYNFLCSHRLDLPLIGTINDINHVFSNSGYVLLGILFLLVVLRRERLEERTDTGIPQHYGLHYTLGVALIVEGLMSACYHFCPNHSNFQFDTSFMYILGVMVLIRIYQSRHPDINANAYLAFGVLAFLIFLGMYGVLNGSYTFYCIFTAIHLLTCMYLTAQIYFMGQWSLDRGVPRRATEAIFSPIKNREEGWWRPKYPSRIVLLVIGNICNWALISVDLYSKLGDFATYLLVIILSNCFLYFVFYIIMKLICGERILLQPLVYLILSTICWAGAAYFFIHKSISWKLTPAESRTYNQHCVLFQFYDNHDIWHFFSAFAMFFSFMLFLTLDDDLTNVDRREIAVF